MKVRKNVIYCLMGFCILWGIEAHAQTQPKERRYILSKVYEVFRNYEESMLLQDESEEYTFLHLFPMEDMVIYNDLLGLSSQSSLSVKTYIETMKGFSKARRAELKNVKILDIVDDRDGAVVKLSFDKSIRYLNNCGVFLSSDLHYGVDHNMVMDVKIDRDDDKHEIVKLAGQINSPIPPLSEDYMVLRKTSPYDLEILCNKEPLKFDSFDQAFLPKNYTFSHGDPDVKFQVINDKDNCNVCYIDYKVKRRYIAPYFEMALGDAYTPSFTNDIISQSSMMEFGIDFGYIFPSKSKFKWGINTGLGYSISTIDYNLKKAYQYCYSAAEDADIDGENYVRHYSLKSMSQTIELTNLVVPVALNFEYYASKYVSLYAQVGVKNYLKMDANTTDFSAEQQVYGVYQGYGKDLVIGNSDAWEYNNFGISHLNETNLRTDAWEGVDYSLDMFGGLGLRVRLLDFATISAGIKYQHSVANVIETNGERFDIDASYVVNNPLISYTVKDGEKTNGLVNISDSYKRNAMMLDLGLIVKF